MASISRWTGIGGLVAIALGGPAAPAFADHAPAFVIPHARSLPPLIDGWDVSGAVIEGDWGLYRPGAGSVSIYPGGGLLIAIPPSAGYFPATGRRPRYGRHEIAPRRRLRPAESYHRSWSSHAPSRVVTTSPPFDPPPVIEGSPLRRHDPRRFRR